MSAEHEERILDASLEEVLGGHYPPDLTSKIIESCEAHRGALQASGTGEPLPIVSQPALPAPPPIQHWAEPQTPPAYDEPAVHVAARPRTVRRSRSGWLAVAAAASVLLAVALGYYLKRESESEGGGIASGRPGPHGTVDPTPENNTVRPRIREQEFVRQEPDGGRREQEMVVHHPGDEPGTAPTPEGPSTPLGRPELPPLKPSSDTEVIAFVNDVLRERWRKNSVTPSPPETDEGWCRRAYDGLVGREPKQDEVDQFVQDDSPEKRQRLVDRLLASDEYAGHWSKMWADALLGPEPSNGNRGMASRAGLEDYMAKSLRADKSYDKVAYELLVATGASGPDAEGYNPAVNFLLAGAVRNAEESTDRVSRVFLGKQLVCTRCHDHPAGDGEAGDFWELNAFFRQMKVRRDPQSGVASLADQDFYGDSGAGKDAEIFYRLPNGRLHLAYPELNGQQLPHSGLLSDVNRRQELAKLVVASHGFRRAVVNRVWARLMGYGFTRPVDDMGPHNPPSHPELLSRLSDELAAHDFNLDGLVRWIVLSDAFGLSDRRTPESWMDAPEAGGRPLFARHYERKRESTDVYRSLMLAVNSKPAGVRITPVAYARRSELRPGAGELKIIDTQPADMFSGPGWLPDLARSRISPQRKIEHLFLSALDRKPTSRELMAAKLVLADQLDDKIALQQIWHTLLAIGERSGS
ncbi:MAG: DUF1549 domain-containing protein [Planctomycetes bacterium]|nr:DUF1549 domain-containing protein [Planctomycetota bacterium]